MTSCASPSEVRFQLINHVGLVTLDRPRALNALTLGMVRAMRHQLADWAHDDQVRAVVLAGAGPRAFCSGGDVVAVVRDVEAGGTLRHDFFREEYALDQSLHRYPKPLAVLMHGIVMGGGMGLAQGAALRLVTSTTRLAMPETRIGLVPDVGASFFLNRLPPPVALYLALTGATLGAADALLLGLADAWSAVEEGDALPGTLAAIAWQGDAQADLRRALMRVEAPRDIAGAALPAILPAVFRHFDPHRPVLETVRALAAAAEGADDRAEPPLRNWCRQTHELLRERSPRMLEAARLALLRGRMLDLAACFEMEFGLVQRAIDSGDFIRGVRAHLIDKTGQPQWQPSTLESLGQG
ncbi:MAG: enoyl-CoA hydratase/isomerase family protein [Pseudomonadota bacterium]